jgi:hypothetical protein
MVVCSPVGAAYPEGIRAMAIRNVYEHKDADIRANAVGSLRRIFPQGAVVWTMVTHVSQSGMGRAIVVLGIDRGEIVDVSAEVARVLGWKMRDESGVWVTGYGMDMVWATVHALAHVLHGDGDALTRRGL